MENIWIPYFDLERDYNEIKSFLLKKDSKLEEAIKEKWGIRILNHGILRDINIFYYFPK